MKYLNLGRCQAGGHDQRYLQRSRSHIKGKLQVFIDVKAIGLELKESRSRSITAQGVGPCPGYVVDDVKPRKRGRFYSSGNIQWQTTAASKAKDRVE